jgi:hypothetical protein
VDAELEHKIQHGGEQFIAFAGYGLQGIKM